MRHYHALPNCQDLTNPHLSAIDLIMPEIDLPTVRQTSKPAKPKRKTGRKRLEEKLPEALTMIQTAYSATGSCRKAAALLGIDKGTVSDVLTRNPDGFATAQKNLAAHAAEYSALALQRAKDTVDKLSGLPAIIAAKTAGQMQLEQLGKLGATVNVQVNIAQALTENMRALATLSTRTPSNQAVQSKPADQPASQPSPATQRAEPA